MLLRLAPGLLLLTAVAAAAEPAAPFKVKSTLDVAYVPNGGDRQKLDVFSPEGQTKRPVVLMIHGGAWMIGDKNLFGLYRDVAVGLAKQGVVVVAANYRLSPWVKHPEHVKDVARAFAWTRRNVAAHGGDPDRIVLLGHSAGGHLVALLATDPSLLVDKELALNDTDRKALRGVVSVSGVYSVPKAEEVKQTAEAMLATLGRMAKPGEKMPAPAAEMARRTALALNPFPLVFGNDPKLQEQASPLHHVRPGLVPFLVLYAEWELPLLADMATRFGDALKKSSNTVEVRRIDRRDHNSIFFGAYRGDDPVQKAILAFVEPQRP